MCKIIMSEVKIYGGLTYDNPSHMLVSCPLHPFFLRSHTSSLGRIAQSGDLTEGRDVDQLLWLG